MKFKPIIIGNKRTGESEPIFIIAEIASAHEGSLKNAKKLLKTAVNAGADAVKFQVFKADKLLTKNHPKYDSFKKIEFNEKEWKKIFQYGEKFNVALLADVFDTESVDLADKYVSAYKIHSTNVSDPYLLLHAAKKRKPILLSTAGCTINEIKTAIKIIKSANKGIILMHGYQGFPTKLKDINLNLLKTLKELFKLPIGLSDHLDAESDMSITLPLVALAFDVSVIEKHITLDRSLKGRDYYSALNPGEFRMLVKKIREVETVLGAGLPKLSKEELKYREKMKKYIVAKIDIPKETKITENALVFKRTIKPGIPPMKIKKIIGKIANANIKKDENITRGKLK